MLAKGKFLKELITAIFVTVGAFCFAVGVAVFFEPYEIAPGGFTGIAILISMILSSFTEFTLPLGIIVILLNLPLFVVAFKVRGFKFGIYSLYTTLLFSFLVDFISFNVDAGGLLVASVCGGALAGFGLGLIIKFGASTGGSDMLALLINRKTERFSTGSLVLILDAFVVLLSVFISGIQIAIYSLLSVVIIGKLLDFVVLGAGGTVVFHIISNETDEISKRILSELKRGATKIPAQGVYSSDRKDLIVCIVSRTQIVLLKRIVKSVDAESFCYTVPVKQVFGNGFSVWLN